MDSYDHIVKIVIIGDSSVGKSNFLLQFTKNEFNIASEPTLGADFGTKTIQCMNQLIRLQIWDTAGQEKYKSITKSYYTNAKGALVLFDITNKVSFVSIDKWISELYSITGGNINIIIIGNKSDLEIERQISYEDGITKAKKYNAFYLETSALLNINIDKAFQYLTEMIYQNNLIESNKENTVKSFIISEITKSEEESTCLC